MYNPKPSTCIKCGSTSFQYIKGKAEGYHHVLHFIQCASCGGVISAIDAAHDKILMELAKKHDIDISSFTYVYN